MSDIEAALRELHIDYRLSGDEAVARCPSHDDRHPSWSVNTRTGIHHCFSCGFSGNFASLVALLLDLSYVEAVIWCNERIGWAIAHRWREDYDNKNFSPQYIRVSEADTALFTAPPDEALLSKGITREASDTFGLLWNPRDMSWIFPVRSPHNGELWGWQSKNDKHFRHYPVGVRRSETLFGMGAFPDGGTAILVESPIDCPYLRSAGIGGGLSSFGVQVSNRQFSLVQHVASKTILALDNDMPGVDRTARACEEDDSLRVFSYVEDTTAKDVGEMTYDQAYYGANGSISALKFLRAIRQSKELRKALDVYRNTRRLPKPSDEEIYRPWLSLSRVLYGTG